MAKLTRRYDRYEFETLMQLIKPYERWTTKERKGWAQEQTGFRHFTAVNITPIEHYRLKPLPPYCGPQRRPAA